MGLSLDVVSDHIAEWEHRLGRGNRPYRKHWPSRLFRHEPLENAARILRSGSLLSRRDATGMIARDIAPETIINNRAAAHDLVRLYFRPKSPTQFRIEGIGKPHEAYEGRQAQALVILVFKATDILTQSDVEFSDGNMQSEATQTGHTDQEFAELPFLRVFHDGPFEPHSEVGADIIRRRCAEVLLPSPLELDGNLQGVLCRSSAERTTLIHLLADTADQWRERIRVSTQPGMFQNRYAYMNTVDGGPKGIAFTIHPRFDSATVATEMWVWDDEDIQVMHFGPTELNPARRWVSRSTLQPGSYRVRFLLEGCFAYEGSFIVDEFPF